IFGPGPGKACTQISGRSDSKDAYATQRLSGENLPDPSRNRDCATAVGKGPPPSGRTMTSSFVCGSFLSKERNFPSGENDTGLSRVPDGSSRVGAALRSAAISHIVMPPACQDLNAICLPSGLQTGAWLIPSVVTLLRTVRANSSKKKSG